MSDSNNQRVVFSSKPTQRLKIGPYQFENGMLVLTLEEAKEFEEVLSRLKPVWRNQVKRLTQLGIEEIEAINRDQQARPSIGATSSNSVMGATPQGLPNKKVPDGESIKAK